MRPIRWTRSWDLCFLFSIAVLIGSYSYFVSRHRILWSDELFGWMLVSDPSWTHMLRAWNLGADGGGIGFYVLCRVWLAILGHSLVAFRAFSAAGIFLAFAATWCSLRLYYRPALAAISLSLTWFGSQMLLWHMVQTRFYGLLVGTTACALYVSLRSATQYDAQARTRTGTLVLTFLANLVLVSTHPFGFVFCALILCAAAVNDLLSRRKRPMFYLAALLPWTVLLFSRTALRSSARVGKPWFWTTRPTLTELRFIYRPIFVPVFAYIALALLLIVFASLLWARQRRMVWASLVERREILIPSLLIFLTPVFFWAASQHGTSYFVERYFCPFAIGVAVLGTQLLSYIFSEPFSLEEPMPLLFALAIALFGCYQTLFHCMLVYSGELMYPFKDFTGQLAAMLPRNEPVVIQRADIFDLMVFYRSAPDLPMYTAIDWDLALSPASPRWLVSAMHEMENWKFAGYYADHIVDSNTFLKTHSRFIVVEDAITPWFQQRIATQPGWHTRKLGRFERGEWTSTIWEVTR